MRDAEDELEGVEQHVELLDADHFDGEEKQKLKEAFDRVSAAKGKIAPPLVGEITGMYSTFFDDAMCIFDSMKYPSKTLHQAPDLLDVCNTILPFLPDDAHDAASKLVSSWEAAEQRIGSAKRAVDVADASVKTIDDQITDHFEGATRMTKQKFESFDDWDTPAFDTFLRQYAPTLRSKRSQAIAASNRAKDAEGNLEDSADEDLGKLLALIKSEFPGFEGWLGLLRSYENVRI